MTTRSQGTCLRYAHFELENWYDVMITWASWLNGLRFPDLIISLKDFFSMISDGRKNFSESSVVHCFRRFAGTIRSIFCFFSAHFWAITIPASIVFPSQTSSAKIAPFESGERKAKRAASIWWGLISTWAFASVSENFSTVSEDLRRVSSCARMRAWYFVRVFKLSE